MTLPQSNPPPDLSGKIALVTGASRGIGRAIAAALARAGAHVLALARTVGGLEELDDEIQASAGETGGACSLIPADLTDAAAIEQLGPALQSRFGKLDIFIANAGELGELAPLTDIAPNVWQRTFDVNVNANWALIRTLDPLLRASADARAIFLTSSIGGEIARAFWGPYAASKAALEMLAKTYALEAARAGVKVAIIDPGAMATRMRALAMPGENQEDLPRPEEITPLVMHALSPDYDGVAERLVFRDWRARGLV